MDMPPEKNNIPESNKTDQGKPIRVLQVFASLDRGGAEAMIMSLYRAIDRSKIQFDFVVNARDVPYAHEDEIRRLGGRIYHVPRYTIANHFGYTKAWRNLLKAHPEWRIVHGHHTTPAFVYLRIAKAQGCLTIAHSHISGADHVLKSKLKRIMRFPLRFLADYLCACSSAAADWMFGSRGKHALVIKNAIDTSDFSYDKVARARIRTELGLDSEFLIGHIGRFEHQKNHLALVQIFNQLRVLCPEAYLLLVGEGGLRSEIEREVKELEVERYVIFAGVRDDVPALLSAMDVFVFPSLYEGLPVTLVEVQAAGLPCLVSDTVSQDAWITDLVKNEKLTASPEIWAQRIACFASGDERKNTTQEIISAGYDIADNAKSLEQFYFKSIK